MLSYKIINGFGECRDCTEDEPNTIKIRVEGEKPYMLFIDAEYTYFNEQGVAHLDLSNLKDGEYTPIVRTFNSTTVKLERIKKSHGRITLARRPDEVIQSVLVRLEEAENKNKMLEKSIDELKKNIKGCELFAPPKE